MSAFVIRHDMPADGPRLVRALCHSCGEELWLDDAPDLGDASEFELEACPLCEGEQ